MEERPVYRDGGGVSVVQNYGQEGFIDFDFAVVFDKAEFPEFVHEEIHAGTGRSNHLG
jgi:hypothetical protein